MSTLALKKLEAEKAGVFAARLNMEAKVEELKESIQRIEKDILIQSAREAELTEKIEQLKGGMSNG